MGEINASHPKFFLPHQTVVSAFKNVSHRAEGAWQGPAVLLHPAVLFLLPAPQEGRVL